MPNKSLKPKGIVRGRTNPFSEIGSCEEVVNLRNKNGVWETMKEKGVFKQYNPYGSTSGAASGVYYHADRAIFRFGNTFSYLTESDLQKNIFTLADGETFVSISSLNDFLVICTSTRKLIYLYSKNDDAYSVMDIPVPQFKAKPGIINESDSSRIHWQYNRNHWDNNSVNNLFSLYEKALEEKRADGFFDGYVIVRCAVKLFSGEYIAYSNPVLIRCGIVSDIYNYEVTDVPEIGFAGEQVNPFEIKIYTYDSYSEFKIEIQRCVSKLHIYLLCNNFYETYIDLQKKGVVSSIDVFVSRPVSPYAAEIEFLQLNVPDTNYREDDVIQFWATPNEDIENELSVSPLYKVGSVEDFTLLANPYEIPFEKNYLINIETNEKLPQDSNSNHSFVFDTSFNYNNRQNVVTKGISLFDGWNIFHDYRDPYKSGTPYFERALLSDTSYTELISIVDVKYPDDKKIRYAYKLLDIKYVVHPLGYNYHYYPMMAMLSYPDVNAKRLRIYGREGTNTDYKKLYEKELIPDLINNYSYCFNFENYPVSYWKTLTVDEISNTKWAYTPFVKNTINYKRFNLLFALSGFNEDISGLKNKSIVETTKNKLKVSDVDNPLLFPIKNTYAFGESDNSIVGMETTQGQVTETKFGMFPLYVFTNQGIFTMEVGQGGMVYSSVFPLSITPCSNPNSIVNCNGFIIFESNGDIRGIANREEITLSRLIDGKCENPIADFMLPEITKAGTFFKDEVKNCTIAYNNEEKEVYLFLRTSKTGLFNSPCNWYYVYNLENKTWSKQKLNFDLNGVVKYKNTFKLWNNDSGMVGSIFISNINDDFSGTHSSDIFIQTKPFTLSEVQLDKISQIISRVYFTANNFEFAVYGSLDCVSWVKIRDISSASKITINQLRASKAFGSCRYFIIVLKCSATDFRLEEFDIEFETKFGGKLR